MTDPALLDVRGLTKSVQRRRIVDDVTFAVPEGSITALVGRNGAGKSTVMRMLVGLVRPDAGVSTFAGSVYHQLHHPAQHVGVALDASAVHPGRSVQETVRLAAALAGVKRRRADDCLLEVGLDGARRTLVGSLSLGMRQRLSLAVALLGEPALFVLDEPANGLDPRSREWLDRYLERHRDAGGGVLVSSHELGWAEGIADEVVVLEQGRVAYSGAPSVDRRETAFASSDDAVLTRRLELAGLSVRSVGGLLRVTAEPRRVFQLAQECGVSLDHLARSTGAGLERLLMEDERPARPPGHAPSGAEGA